MRYLIITICMIIIAFNSCKSADAGEFTATLISQTYDLEINQYVCVYSIGDAPIIQYNGASLCPISTVVNI